MLADLVLQGSELPAYLATLPLWPLLGTLIVGLLLATNRAKALAAPAIIFTVGVSMVLGVITFWGLQQDGGGAAHAAAGSVHVIAVAEDPVAPGAAGEDGATTAAGDHAAADHGHAAGPHTVRYQERTIFHWISLGLTASGATRWLDVNFYVDSLTGIMLLVVTIISLMVVIYATGYMKDHHGHKEEGYERFFAWLGLFVFSMLMLVLAGNFALLYLGWEAVGLCSFLLIGFYYQKPAAAAAAKKAFLVNRIGDLGFALGIFALYYALRPLVPDAENPLDYVTFFKYVHLLNDQTVLGVHAPTLIGLLLMCGALGKSAQFPLYVWLPDAMEGPTPVSALIHAATMVTAGIYMIARLGPLYAMSPAALSVILWLGLIGAVLAATMAMAQYDMKRILAYSTMSQLAFMFVALGAGVPQAAIFHLFTHAFFKALLFLGAGGVMHSMGNMIDIRFFSGLRAIMPKTYWLMLIGCLALAGFPLLAGFWSKDEIIHGVLEHNRVAGYILLATAALTAYYTFRMFFLCFNGPVRTPPEAGDHPHDSPPAMILPLVPLALGALFAGFIGVSLKSSSTDSFLTILYPHGFYHAYVADSSMVIPAHHGGGAFWMYVSSAIALGGIGLAYLRYGAAPRHEPDQQVLGPIWNLWNAKYYVDEIYQALLVEPLRSLGRLFFGADKRGIDGLVNFIGRVPVGLGLVARSVQRGAVQGYALVMVVGLAVLLLVWRWFLPMGPSAS